MLANWLSRSEPRSALLDGNPWVVIVGSAISKPSPPGMPLTTEAIGGFLNAALRLLKKQDIIEVDNIESEIRGIAKVVKFERFFSILSDYFGTVPRQLASQLYSDVRPNANHRGVAVLGEMGHSIYTTNFDLNIEASRVNTDTEVKHLHGRANDPQSMVLTMRQLADTARPELTALREDLAQIRRVACIGYSGLGDIDILPTLQWATSQEVIAYWFGRRGFSAPTRGRVFHHDLRDRSNIISRWSGVRVPRVEWPSSERVMETVEERVLALFATFPAQLMLRALAAVAHEARFGALALNLYRIASDRFGPSTVSDYEWGVANERAGEYGEAARHLTKAASLSRGPESVSHQAGAAYCYRQQGMLKQAKDAYDTARTELLRTSSTTAAQADNVLRGRAEVYVKLAASMRDGRRRRSLLEDAELAKDLAFLRRKKGHQKERLGGLDLLQGFAQFELDLLGEHLSRSSLQQEASRLWTLSKGHQDLEIQAKAARLVSSVDRGKGRAATIQTLWRILKTGASGRDAGKLLLSLALTLLPFLHGRWQFLTPPEFIRAAFRRPKEGVHG